MPRARNIKPSIMDNEELADLSPATRLLFIYLWMLADREGRLEDRPRRIGAQALPYDRDVDVDDALQSLHDAGFIQRYQVGDLRVIQILTFSSHQHPHMKEKQSDLPAYDAEIATEIDKHQKSPVQAPEKHQKSPSDSLIPDSLIPDSSHSVRGIAPNGAPAPDGADDPPDDPPGDTPSRAEPVPYAEIVTAYHETLPELAAVRAVTSKRKAAMRQRHGGLMGKSLDNWRAYFAAVSQSDFLMGRVDGKSWRADFDFLTSERAVVGVMEGKYRGSHHQPGWPHENSRRLSGAERTRLARDQLRQERERREVDYQYSG